MKPIRVVIVEDDPQIAEIQQRFILRLADFEVVGMAHSLGDALELIPILQPQLLLLDIHFPQGNGLELLRELRSQQSPVDVIIMTAATEVETLTEAMRYGVFSYILKPLVFERLEKSLRAYQQQHHQLQGLTSLDQQLVDRLIAHPTSAHLTSAHPSPTSASRLPKGIDPLTLDKVRAFFAEQPSTSFSAEEVGQALGTSRTTARRYLEHLTSQTELQADVAYGSVGRPERRYQAIRPPADARSTKPS